MNWLFNFKQISSTHTIIGLFLWFTNSWFLLDWFFNYYKIDYVKLWFKFIFIIFFIFFTIFHFLSQFFTFCHNFYLKEKDKSVRMNVCDHCKKEFSSPYTLKTHQKTAVVGCFLAKNQSQTHTTWQIEATRPPDTRPPNR